MRVRGSVRFADYYKIQWFNDAPGMHVWVDIQRQYPTEAAARAAFPRKRRCRVMQVTEAGRAPLPEAARA
jgi:hypothetical protein